MRQFDDSTDDRTKGFCVFCGGNTETRDHVPPKVFLDEPYPTNLPVVSACQSCNERISLDEEYVACFLECVSVGSVKSSDIEREKIRRILERKPALVAKLSKARREYSDGTYYAVEEDRVEKVIVKLAKGHAAFELGDPQLDAPTGVAFMPFPSIPLYMLQNFESLPKKHLWPECGSRGMQRIACEGALSWTNVQSGRYRYLAYVDDQMITVRMVIREYLACEVKWSIWQEEI